MVIILLKEMDYWAMFFTFTVMIDRYQYFSPSVGIGFGVAPGSSEPGP